MGEISGLCSNQLTHFAQSFHSVFAKGAFTLINHLPHDLLRGLLAINSPRVSVVPLFTRIFQWPSNGNILGKSSPSLANTLEACPAFAIDLRQVYRTREPSLPPPRLSWIATCPYLTTGPQDSSTMVTTPPYHFPHPPESLPALGAPSSTLPTSTRCLDHRTSAFGPIIPTVATPAFRTGF